MGPYIFKLAEELLMKLRVHSENKIKGRGNVQEKLSFVRMEYFLYAFTEAYNMMRELRQLNNLVDSLHERITENENRIRKLRTEVVLSNDQSVISKYEKDSPDYKIRKLAENT